MQKLEIKGIELSVTETYLIKCSFIDLNLIKPQAKPDDGGGQGRFHLLEKAMNFNMPWQQNTFLIKGVDLIQLGTKLRGNKHRKAVLAFTMNSQQVRLAQNVSLIGAGNWVLKSEALCLSWWVEAS